MTLAGILGDSRAGDLSEVDNLASPFQSLGIRRGDAVFAQLSPQEVRGDPRDFAILGSLLQNSALS